MDAPTYPPALAYEAPVVLPHRLSTRHTSISELRQHPAAWAIVVKELPAIPMVIASPIAIPHLGNVPLAALVDLRLADQATLDRIEAGFATLGTVR